MADIDYTGERWLPIAGFDSYEVSDLGRVRRMPTRWRPNMKIKAQGTSTRGYRQVSLAGPRGHTVRSVHTLVALAFHGAKPAPDYEVAHNDGDKLNNRADNLRWATRAGNSADRVIHGTDCRGAKNARACLTELEVREIRALRRYNGIRDDLAARYGVSKCTIGRIRATKAEAWKHLF